MFKTEDLRRCLKDRSCHYGPDLRFFQELSHSRDFTGALPTSADMNRLTPHGRETLKRCCGCRHAGRHDHVWLAPPSRGDQPRDLRNLPADTASARIPGVQDHRKTGPGAPRRLRAIESQALAPGAAPEIQAFAQ